MAKKDILTLNSGATITAVNLDLRVGAGGENRGADVMLVQSLFQYIGRVQDLGKRLLGEIRLPRIDGHCGAITLRAIRHFQHKHSHRLLKVDGVIHPATYTGRKIADVSKPVMAITLLHMFAGDAATGVMDSDLDYIAGLIRLEPRLGPFLR